MYLTCAQDSDSMHVTCAQDSELLVFFAWRLRHFDDIKQAWGESERKSTRWVAWKKRQRRWQLTQSILTVLSIVRWFRWTVFFSPVPSNSMNYFRSNLRKLRNAVASELTVQPPFACVCVCCVRACVCGGWGCWYSCVSDSSPNKR